MNNVTTHGSGLKLEHLTFSVLDYALFAGMLVVSALVGVFFGVFKKQKTTDDYLLGGRNMGVIPVAISVTASSISAVMILGLPGEIYNYGAKYVMSAVSGVIVAVIVTKVYIPVFYRLQLTSSFEYLDVRFDKKVRLIASFLCLLGMLLTMPVVMYVPAMAFNLVSGFEVNHISPIISVVCIFYTAMGGLKAVIWTDTIQFLSMLGAIFFVFFMGIPEDGGISKVMEIAEKSGRLNFIDFDFSPFTRISLFSLTICISFSHLSSVGVSQMFIQRYLSVPTLKDAKRVLYIYLVAFAIVKLTCMFSGLIIFGRYSGCDPVSAGIISKVDQILPYYVLDTARNIPGLPGLFIAGIFGAALSTLSSIFNTASGIIFKDFICLFISPDTSEARGSSIMKVLVVILGISCTTMSSLMAKLSNIIQIFMTFHGVTYGSLLGVFSMGMLIPRANVNGVLSGAITSLLLMSWMAIGNNRAIANGFLKYPSKPFSTEFCEFETNNTILKKPFTHDESTEEEVFFLYRVSFMWYTMIGTLVVFLVGLPVSYFTSPPSPEQTKPEYFSPVIRRFLSKDILDREQGSKNKEKGEYKPVDILLQDLKDKVIDNK